MRTAEEVKQAWLIATQTVLTVSQQDLCAARVEASLPAPLTVEDVVADFPHGPFMDSADGEDALDGGDDAVEDEDAVEVEDVEMADADLEHAVLEAAGLGDLAHEAALLAGGVATANEESVADALEEELAQQAPGAAEEDPGESTIVPEPEAGEPAGAAAHVVTAGGKTLRMHLSHRAALGVLQWRQGHVHALTISAETGESIVPYVVGMRVPKIGSGFSVFQATLAHSSGEEILHKVEATLRGSLPVLLARYRNLSTHVQEALDATGMCVVMGCPRRKNAKKTYKSLHACPDHEKPDCQVHGTEEVVRLCTACRGQRNVEVFREGQGSERTGGCCERCTILRRNKEGKNVPPLVAPEHTPPSAAELANGEDPDGTFIRERRAAEQRLVGDDTRPGETMSNPLLVLAVHDPARKGHEKECVRVGCDNAAKFNVDRRNGQEVIRPDPTLCGGCYGVCLRDLCK